MMMMTQKQEWCHNETISSLYINERIESTKKYMGDIMIVVWKMRTDEILSCKEIKESHANEKP